MVDGDVLLEFNFTRRLSAAFFDAAARATSHVPRVVTRETRIAWLEECHRHSSLVLFLASSVVRQWCTIVCPLLVNLNCCRMFSNKIFAVFWPDLGAGARHTAQKYQSP